MKRTPRAKYGQEFNLWDRELVLTVTIGQTDFLDCITKKDFMLNPLNDINEVCRENGGYR